MTAAQIEEILASVFRLRSEAQAGPTSEDWRALAERFRCEFPDDFILFHSVVGRFWFEGELLEIPSASDVNIDDTILIAYSVEAEIGSWPREMIPFYSVGNGDYECLNSNEGKNSCVYYVRHEDRSFRKANESFSEWIIKIPESV